MIYGLQFGSKFIPDILNAKAHEIDQSAITPRLRVIHRFSNNPAALTVHQHRKFVPMLAEKARIHPVQLHGEVMAWCEHHDDHEAITGDWPGPMKKLVGTETDVLDRVEFSLDNAICAGIGLAYPSQEVRDIVHVYDKMAETIEWVHVLGHDLAQWNQPVHPSIDDEFIRRSLSWVRQL